MIGGGLVVNDWCAFTGLETTATEISVIEAAFSQGFLIAPVWVFLIYFFSYRASRTGFSSSDRRDAGFTNRQLGVIADLIPSLYRLEKTPADGTIFI